MPTEPTPTYATPLATEWCRQNGKRPKHVVRDDGSETWWWGRQWPEDDDAEYKLPGPVWHLTPSVHDTELAAMMALEAALRDCRAACGADEAQAAATERAAKIVDDYAARGGQGMSSWLRKIAAAIRRGD